VDILPVGPTVKGPADAFTGDVWVNMIAHGEQTFRLRVGIVRFAPGAHTAWHCHEGRGLVQ
jgi:quercetin dioxygenase-like cupin family protein